jgi:hypothetical protein
MIDSVAPADPDFAASFNDIARVNRYLGGTRAVLRALDPLMRDLGASGRGVAEAPGGAVRILDLATGSADIPRAIVRAARRGRWGNPHGASGFRVEIVAADNHPKVLGLARRLSEAYPEIVVVEADAFALPFADGAFDIALCSMAFHHFGEGNCIDVLRAMDRVSRAGFVVNDLVRDRVACGLIWTLTRLAGANRLTRHDAPLSVLRAFTIDEYVGMVRAAGISGCEVRTAPFYRAVIVRSRLRAGDAGVAGPAPG